METVTATLTMALPWTLLAMLALAVGSFLNLASLRLPKMLVAEPATAAPGIVFTRSRCTHCGTALGAVELVPVLSYAVLRGRCAHCGGVIARRELMVELLACVLSLAVAAQLGWTLPAAAALLLTWMLLLLALVDGDCMLLPDALTLPGLWCGLLLNAVGVLGAGAADAVLGAAGAYLFLFVVYHLHRAATKKEGMGHGDFKLAAMLGAWLGWQHMFFILFAAAAAGALAGLCINARKRGAGAPLPWGPFLAAAGWVALLWGDAIAAWHGTWGG